MIPTFLDLRTGKTTKGYDMSYFWWTEGNGSCDCNRVRGFGVALAAELEAQHSGVCYGCKRFVAIDVEGDLEYDEEWRGGVVTKIPHTKERALVDLNARYCK
jgi:hypothetical protein